LDAIQQGPKVIEACLGAPGAAGPDSPNSVERARG
jgi:hypothetical protein